MNEQRLKKGLRIFRRKRGDCPYSALVRAGYTGSEILEIYHADLEKQRRRTVKKCDI